MAVALGILIGLSLGLLGGGGSILTVPIFVYVFHFGPKEAIAMSLAVVGATSTVGAAGHWRAGNVNVRVGAVFGAVAMAGTYAGARLAVLLSGTAQLTIFGVVMLTAAAFMFRGRRADAAERSSALVFGRTLAVVVFEALGVGLLTGVVGVGGGFLIVPALVLLGLPMREAVGTSLAVIATNCVVGVAGYIGRVQMDWTAVALVTAGTVPGITAGVYLHRFVPQQALRRAFSFFLVAVAVWILYQNLSTALATRS
ncbi:MAG: sulfite exporter TauE/SafE family protein [Acidobacteriota bacterium]